MILLLLLGGCLPPFPGWTGGADTGLPGDGGSLDGGSLDGGSLDGGSLDGGATDGDGDGWTVAQGDCDDGDAKVNPDAAEVCNDGLDNDCDGTPNQCMLAGALDTDDAAAAVEGLVTDGYLGTSAAVLPDAHGRSLVLGAPWDDNGHIYVMATPLTGTVSTNSADGAWTTALAGAQLGQDMAVGDIDGDGVQDLVTTGHVAGALGGSAVSGGGAALAWLVYGPFAGEGGDLADVGGVLSMGEPATLYGRTFVDGPAAVGNDGVVNDLIFGAIHYPTADRQTSIAGGAGDVWVVSAEEVSGGTLPGSAAHLEGANSGDRLGSDVALVDLNGDGLADLVAGAEAYDNAPLSAGLGDGRVYIILNDTGALPSGDPDDVADLLITPGAHSAMLGFAVSGIADFDGDGVRDLAVSAPNSDWGAQRQGEVAVFTWTQLSSGPRDRDTSDAELLVVGWDSEAATGGSLGRSLDPAGDVDGDGLGDLLAGAPSQSPTDSSAEQAGAFWLIHGGQTGSLLLDLDHATHVFGPTGSELGSAAWAGDDLTGDGVPDLLLTGGAHDDGRGAAWVLAGITQ